MSSHRHSSPNHATPWQVQGAPRLEDASAFKRSGRSNRAGLLVRLLVFMWCIGSVVVAQQTTWHVDAAVAPGGNGSQQSPFNAIQPAITTAAVGDTVLVQPGSYAPINFLGKDIVVLSASGSFQTIIQGTMGTPTVSFANGETALASMTGFTIVGGIAANGAGINCSTGSPIITNCTIVSNVAQANGGGVFVGPNESPVFRNCIVAGNISALSGGGVYVSLNATPRFINCTVYGNTANGLGGGFYMNSSAQAEITNSILWNNQPSEIDLASLVQPLIVYSIVQGGYFGINVINADPVFIDGPNFDFHICGASPAMDAGTPVVSGLPSVDFEGDPRISGIAVDIGVDEFVPPAGNGTWYVDGSASIAGSGCGLVALPFLTIQAAINVAISGDLILVAPGLYVENLDYLGKDITVRSVNGPLATIVNGSAAGTTVTFQSGETGAAVLDGFAINGGLATTGGGVLLSNASPSIVNCIIENNSAINGGGLACIFGSAPNLTGCVIDTNQATSGMGGGVFCDVSSSPVLLACTISNNTASLFGGGVYCDSNPVLNSVDFTNNAAGLNGGGLFCDNDALPTLFDCSFLSNQSSLDGGGAACDAQGGLIATNTTWTSNSAGRHGGGISLVSNGILSLTSCILDQNSAGQLGGALYIGSMTTGTVLSTTLSGGTAVGEGGGAYIGSDAAITFALCTIVGNGATFGRGGGFLIRDNALAVIDECTIESNNANGFLTGSGGGIACIDNSAPSISDCSIINNTASDWGGGVLIESYSSPTITSCVIAGNGALYGGGIGCRSFSNAHLERCRIASNTALMNGGGLAIADANLTPLGLEVVLNTAGGVGGGILCDNASPSFVNITIAVNQGSGGGGLHCMGTSSPTFVNTIFQGDLPDEIASSTVLGITNSNVAGGYPGLGNMDTDALFNAPSAADFHLRLDSPCRNTGNTAAAAALSFDIDGDDRVAEGIVDIGADEAYFQTISQPTGGASFTISLHNLPSFDLYLTVFSFDPANQGLGLGTGWWGGLHISLFEVLAQAGTGSPPFMGYLDAVGNATWSITGSAVVAGLSGVTIYSVTRVFDPINYFAEGWSNLTPHTFQ